MVTVTTVTSCYYCCCYCCRCCCCWLPRHRDSHLLLVVRCVECRQVSRPSRCVGAVDLGHVSRYRPSGHQQRLPSQHSVRACHHLQRQGRARELSLLDHLSDVPTARAQYSGSYSTASPAALSIDRLQLLALYLHSSPTTQPPLYYSTHSLLRRVAFFHF